MTEPSLSPLESPQVATPEESRGQLEALLEVSEAIAQHRDLKALFHDLSKRLRTVVAFDFLSLVLHDPVQNVMRLHVLEALEPTKVETGTEAPVDQYPSGWVWQTQQPFLVADTTTETRYPQFAQFLAAQGVRSAAIVPLTTAQHRIGALGFGRNTPGGIRGAEVQFMQRVASQVAVAVDNALNTESAQEYQRQLARERDRLQVLLEVNNLLLAHRDLEELFRGIVSVLQRVIHHDYTSLALHDPATGLLRIHALDFPGGQTLLRPETAVALDATPSGRCFSKVEPCVVRGAEIDRFESETMRALRAAGVESVCCVPLFTHGRTLGSLNLASKRPDAFSESEVALLQQVGGQVAIAVENALAFQEIDALKDKLTEEKVYLEEEIRSEFNFEEIIGESAALKRTLAQVELVAGASTTVLILGETGTGKELIARAIHNRSPRRERTFVKVNCAAIPSGLLESELFGHERGAFTGALAQKIGRFELADRGTLFLDEVGDIPLELQPKLLRVLQEQEFERLGSATTIRVDVRVVAATNQDLARLVAEKKFRSDLYYRLNVFPISVPALRERPEDFPLLVRYFVQRYSRQLNKNVQYVPAEVMAALAGYSWPGNIRELENLIERAVLLSPGTELRVPLGELKDAAGVPVSAVSSAATVNLAAPIATLEESERQHILRALRQSEWRVAGPRGAAALLGMKRTTLQARMRKLGIRRPA
ncbi:MAG TPA: sigma 54-interacting transcriptional regulator [Methylomirabilota bacterium]|nr:sigma 54-interacting transcriptional regulator [Methylomirabilota bacterium]